MEKTKGAFVSTERTSGSTEKESASTEKASVLAERNPVSLVRLPVSVLSSFPEVEEEKIRQVFEEEYQNFHKKIVVLDDDPTGTQTVHGVPVYTDMSMEWLKDGMESPENMFFFLTNSRSFTAQKTEEYHRELTGRLLHAAEEQGKELLLISRGDSTLRGHYPLELDVLKEEWEAASGKKADGQIICPYFREGGRFTIDSVHYVKEGEWLVPAGETEFARDKTFGYRSSHLGDYVEEKSGGKYRKQDCICITLKLLRKMDYQAITELLLQSKDFSPILVDAVSEADVMIFVTCLLRALAQGKEFMIRSAAAIPKVIGNIASRSVLTREEINSREEMHSKEEMYSEDETNTMEKIHSMEDIHSGEGSAEETKNYGGLVIVGSHVKKTTGQLNALRQSKAPLMFLEFDVNAWFKPEGLSGETNRMIEEAEKAMKEGKTAVIYTSRKLLAPEGADGETLLNLSVSLSDALTAIVTGLHRKPAFLIAKGGITSSDVATKGLGIKKAMVIGQASPGIPVWRTGAESKFPGLHYIIFPGNVGETDTLKEIVDQLTEN